MKQSQPDSSHKTNTYFKLLEALPRPGCAICRLTEDALRQYIGDLFSEHLSVTERRNEMRLARGFCPTHAPLIDDYGRILGIAVLHNDMLSRTLNDVNSALRSTPVTQRRISAVREAIKPKRECIFCEYSRTQETFALRTLVREMLDSELHAAFAKSSGLCLPHFQRALALRDLPNANLTELIRIEVNILSQLNQELETFVHKSNLAYAHETMEREADAPRRSIQMVSGRVTGRDSRS